MGFYGQACWVLPSDLLPQVLLRESKTKPVGQTVEAGIDSHLFVRWLNSPPGGHEGLPTQKLDSLSGVYPSGQYGNERGKS